jgi:hypothetical protein
LVVDSFYSFDYEDYQNIYKINEEWLANQLVRGEFKPEHRLRIIKLAVRNKIFLTLQWFSDHILRPEFSSQQILTGGKVSWSNAQKLRPEIWTKKILDLYAKN